MKDAQIRCGDYINGLERVEQAIERSTRTGIRFRNIPDLWINKAQLLVLKAQKEGNDSLYDEAEVLLNQSLKYADQQGLRGKEARISLIYSNFLKERGKLQAFEEFKPKARALLMQIGASNVTYLSWEAVEELLTYFSRFHRLPGTVVLF